MCEKSQIFHRLKVGDVGNKKGLLFCTPVFYHRATTGQIFSPAPERLREINARIQRRDLLIESGNSLLWDQENSSCFKVTAGHQELSNAAANNKDAKETR